MSEYPKTGGSYRINEKGEFVRATDEKPAAPAKPEPKTDEPEAKTK